MKRLFPILLALLTLVSAPAHAEDMTGSVFVVKDAVFTVGGGLSSSANFRHYSSTGSLDVPGESASAAFTALHGEEYAPELTNPVVIATAGDAQVSLSWTAAQAYFGATLSSYRIGQATVSGGPYTYTDVGLVTSSIATGLTNGTTYYFVVQTYDANLGTYTNSAQVSALPTGPGSESTGGGGGGGGGGSTSYPVNANSVTFTGRAYPNSQVTLLKDAQIAVQTVAGATAEFSMTLNNLSAGTYNFGIFGTDEDGVTSSVQTFTLTVTTSSMTSVSGVFISPTIGVDKQQVKQGDNIAIFGQSIPASQVTIVVNSDEPHFVQTSTDDSGAYLYAFDTSPLENGNHNTASKASTGAEISAFGRPVGFLVGATDTLDSSTCGRGDLNCDGRVNLVDFAIAAHWYKQPLDDAFAIREKNLLNGDGVIDLVDFAIMSFYWTG